MQPMWRVYLVSGLLASAVAAGTALVTVRLAAPPGAHAPNRDSRAEATVVLEGEAEVPLARSTEQPSELEVFYKSPFAAPPHLTFPEGLANGCQVADQKAVSFKLRRIQSGGGLVYAKVKWKAEGQPAK
jgi:hypothetical protein